MSKKALGRGIEALIKVSGDKHDISSVSEVPIDSLQPNPYQPRKEFDEESLKELAFDLLLTYHNRCFSNHSPVSFTNSSIQFSRL